ncbi:hypothetical protein EYF80_058049 [Liparis tanakae]|uniref:Uncharacterized protein n=1 Tax=Liparis tanakae TaxID=230148 RepID=A0A4Z2ETU6_9TELE|nr:hypothetical protein EYF80_058049 [Liparis tanakae]
MSPGCEEETHGVWTLDMKKDDDDRDVSRRSHLAERRGVSVAVRPRLRCCCGNSFILTTTFC